jgi:hypothetical protein
VSRPSIQYPPHTTFQVWSFLRGNVIYDWHELTSKLAEINWRQEHSTPSSCLSVRLSSCNNWTPTGRIFHGIWYLWIFRKYVKIQVSLKSDKNMGHFTWTPICTFDCLVEYFVEWETVQTKVVRKIKTHFEFNNFSVFENRVFFKNKSKGNVTPLQTRCGPEGG